jgi:putative transposase
MKRSNFTEEQILFALKQANAGQPADDVCRQMEIGEATFYVRKKRYGNQGLLEVRELRQLRDENVWLKRLVADLPLDWHRRSPYSVAERFGVFRYLTLPPIPYGLRLEHRQF